MEETIEELLRRELKDGLKSRNKDKRGEWDIYFKILSICRNLISTKTQIAYEGNFCQSRTDRYIDFLEQHKLLSVTNVGYLITSKGSEFLERYSKLKQFLMPTK